MRLQRCSLRLHPRLLEARLLRTRDRLEALGRRAERSLARMTGPRRARLERIGGRIAPQVVVERVARGRERVAARSQRFATALLGQLAAHRRHLEASCKLLDSLGYHAVLKRGYALVRDGEGRTVRSVAQVAAGQRLDIELGDGNLDVRIEGGR